MQVDTKVKEVTMIELFKLHHGLDTGFGQMYMDSTVKKNVSLDIYTTGIKTMFYPGENINNTKFNVVKEVWND